MRKLIARKEGEKIAMHTEYRVFLTIFFIFLGILVVSNEVYANDVNVVLMAVPDIEKIPIGANVKIWVIAQTNEENLIIDFSLDGPGELLSGPTRFIKKYLPPSKIEGEKKATITVSLLGVNDKGNVDIKADDNVTFTLYESTGPVLTSDEPTRIRQVRLKKEDDTVITPTYFVRSKETVTIDVDITPSDPDIGVECKAIFGKIASSSQQKIIYTAPAKSGGSDIVTVRAVDKNTGKILVQEIINITIRD